MNSFYLDSSDASFWVPGPKAPFTISTDAIEKDNIEALVGAILSELIYSAEEEKLQYAPMLRKWLSKMSEKDLDMSDIEKVRDLIYEMF